jgi:hypothetical protein
MDERIELTEPELVTMRPEERREAVGLLAALIRAASSSLPASDARSGTRNLPRVAEELPLARGANGKAASADTPGEAA